MGTISYAELEGSHYHQILENYSDSFFRCYIWLFAFSELEWQRFNIDWILLLWASEVLLAEESIFQWCEALIDQQT